MPLDSAWFQARADELRAEEEAAQREKRDADTAAEREAADARIAKLESELAELREQAASPPPPAAESGPDGEEDDDEDEEGEGERKPRMRKGRKHGQVYQDERGGMGYVYQGEDEPDLVPADEDAA